MRTPGGKPGEAAMESIEVIDKDFRVERNTAHAARSFYGHSGKHRTGATRG